MTGCRTDFRPLLAATVLANKIDSLPYPLLASPKLDGIRAIFWRGRLVSRSLKDIPNSHTQELFNLLCAIHMEGLDGELIVGDPTAPDAFRTTSSAVMSKDGIPDVSFHVFDVVLPGRDLGFNARSAEVSRRLRLLKSSRVIAVPHRMVVGPDELLALEAEWLAQGYEGVMLRRVDGLYKYGRSTLGEAHLLKVKQFMDGEAIIIGVEQLMHNTNEAKRNALGHLERSSHKAGKVGAGMLGALKVRDMKTGVEFDIGTGFDEATRKLLWHKRKVLVGELVKYKHFPGGVKEKPRFPVFLGLRSRDDL